MGDVNYCDESSSTEDPNLDHQELQIRRTSQRTQAGRLRLRQDTASAAHVWVVFQLKHRWADSNPGRRRPEIGGISPAGSVCLSVGVPVVFLLAGHQFPCKHVKRRVPLESYKVRVVASEEQVRVTLQLYSTRG